MLNANLVTLIRNICFGSLESLPVPCEITSVTFATWGQEVREDRNAFLFSVLFSRNTQMFIPETGCFFVFFNSFKERLLNNWEHGIIKGSKTPSHVVYRKVWLLIGDVCCVINYRWRRLQCWRTNNTPCVCLRMHWLRRKQTEVAVTGKPKHISCNNSCRLQK